MTRRAIHGLPARLALGAALAGVLAALALILAPGRTHEAVHPMHRLSPKAVAFTRTMDRLWEDHVTWTRMVIVDFAAGLPDLQTAEARLLQNQADIGNALRPYYGAKAAAQLTNLLRTHILEAVPVLQAAKAGDDAALGPALDTWYANAREIAVFLSRANPRDWPLPMMSTMMKRHLDLTTAEAVARLHGDWAADVAAYDRVHAEILDMSRMLSDGIIRQFPRRF